MSLKRTDKNFSKPLLKYHNQTFTQNNIATEFLKKMLFSSLYMFKYL